MQNTYIDVESVKIVVFQQAKRLLNGPDLLVVVQPSKQNRNRKNIRYLTEDLQSQRHVFIFPCYASVVTS